MASRTAAIVLGLAALGFAASVPAQQIINPNPNADIDVDSSNSIETTGNQQHGITSTGDGADIDINDGGSIETRGNSAHGIRTEGMDVMITVGGTIETHGSRSAGISAADTANIHLTATGLIRTNGGTGFADAISTNGEGSTVTVDGRIETLGAQDFGILVTASGHRTVVNINEGAVVRTTGLRAGGIAVAGRDATVTVDGTVETTGASAFAIFSQRSDIDITVNGMITTTGAGAHGIALALSGATEEMVTINGVVEVTGTGAYAIASNGSPTVRLMPGSRVTGSRRGISIANRGTGAPTRTCFLPNLGPLYRSCVSVFGTVEADGSQGQDANGNPVPSAAVFIQGGGVLTIGPQGRVEHKTEGQNAVVFEGEGPAAIVYLVQGTQGAGMRGNEDGILGNVEIPETAAYHALMLPDDVDPAELLDAIEAFHRGDRSQEDLDALLARVQMVNLREEDVVFEEDYLYTTIRAYDFEADRFDQTREIAPRGRVYEALPSVLLSVNRPLSHDDRWNAPRAGGWWMWTEAAGGDWEADASTEQEGTAEEENTLANGAYDYDRYAVEIGVDWAPSENAVLGLVAHYRNIDADVDGGRIDAHGYGVGVSARASGEKAYLAVQGSATWYEADLSSSGVGMLRDDVDGFGWSAGAEVGYRQEFGEVAVTPRVGLTYSEVDLDSFQGPESRVSLEDGESVIGRAGVRLQRGGLYAAVDVEHEFSDDERRVEATGTDFQSREVTAVLESKAEDTWVRATAGGIHEWGEGRYSLHARLSYAESGGSNDEFGGSLTLQGRF